MSSGLRLPQKKTSDFSSLWDGCGTGTEQVPRAAIFPRPYWVWHYIKLWWQGGENGMGHLESLWWCHWCYCSILRIGSHASHFNHRRLHGCTGAFCCPALWSHQHPWTCNLGSHASVHPEWQINRCSPTDSWSPHTTHQESCLPKWLHLGPDDGLHTRAPMSKCMGLGSH